MNYGLSNAVDTLATTSGYNHPNAHVLLGSAPWMLLDNTESPLLPRHRVLKIEKKQRTKKRAKKFWKFTFRKIDATAHHTILMKGEEVLKKSSRSEKQTRQLMQTILMNVHKTKKHRDTSSVPNPNHNAHHT